MPRPAATYSKMEEAPSAAATQSGVFIGHLEIEVIPPVAEKPVAKPVARPPTQAAPVSQIGPLRRVPSRLAFSIRHR